MDHMSAISCVVVVIWNLDGLSGSWIYSDKACQLKLALFVPTALIQPSRYEVFVVTRLPLATEAASIVLFIEDDW